MKFLVILSLTFAVNHAYAGDNRGLTQFEVATKLSSNNVTNISSVKVWTHGWSGDYNLDRIAPDQIDCMSQALVEYKAAIDLMGISQNEFSAKVRSLEFDVKTSHESVAAQWFLHVGAAANKEKRTISLFQNVVSIKGAPSQCLRPNRFEIAVALNELLEVVK